MLDSVLVVDRIQGPRSQRGVPLRQELSSAATAVVGRASVLGRSLDPTVWFGGSCAGCATVRCEN